MNNKLKIFITSGITLTFLLVLFSLIKWEYKVTAPCRFVPQMEWSVYELESGRVVARLVSNNPYQVSDFHLLQFDRQDFVKLLISQSVRPGNFIEKGTIIGTVSSSENQIRFNELQGQLESARADLQTFMSGSKAETQEMVMKELEYAKAAFERFEPQLQRKRDLFKQNLISYEELEQAETQYQLLELNVEVAHAKLKAEQSGDKEEIINAYQINIQAIENQIDAFQTKLAASQITTPIKGIVMDSYALNNICSIAQLDTMIAQIPIEETKIQFIHADNLVQFKIPALSNRSFQGNIVDIGKNAQPVNGSMRFIVSSAITNPDRSLLPGMTGYAKIFCDRLSIWHLLQRWWQTSKGRSFF